MFKVDLNKNPTLHWTERVKCRCDYHRALGYPCLHASYALLFLTHTVKKHRLNDMIKTKDWLYHLPLWYSDIFHLVNIVSQYSTTVVLPNSTAFMRHQLWPPLVTIPPGRPKKNRMRGPPQQTRTIHTAEENYEDLMDPQLPPILREKTFLKCCTSCGSSDHNCRTCKNKNTQYIVSKHTKNSFLCRLPCIDQHLRVRRFPSFKY